MADAETEPVATEEVPAEQLAGDQAPAGDTAETAAEAVAAPAEVAAEAVAGENGTGDETAAPGDAEAAAPASRVPPDAAVRAAEVAARLAAQPGQAYPVSSGADHAGEDDSNKRKLEISEDPNDPNKRLYTEGQYQGQNPSGDVLPPIAPGIGSQPDYGSGEATEIIQCPPSIVGKVIGKGGETIRDLQNRTGARIQVDHTAEEGRPRAVTITGHTSAVAAAKKLVDDVIAAGENPAGGAGDVQQSVNCPPGIVGRVIGRGGETIRALQSASGAHISIDQNFPEGMDRQVHVQGNAEAVERGVKMVTELIAGGPGSANDAIQKHGGGLTQALQCPKSMVGRVIGKGGETIKALQNTTGARIQIDQSTDPMTVTLTGAPDAVQRAEAAVTDIINGGSGFLQSPYGGAAGGYQQPGYGGYQQGYQQSYPGYQAYGGYNQQQQYQPYGQAGAYSYGQGYQQPAAAGGYSGYQQQGGYQAPASQAYSTSQGYQGQYQSGAGQQAQYGSDPSQAAAPAAGAGSGVWQELHDPQGRPYYYNSQTGVSQWEKPAEMQ
eukprot:CAMPEP_0117666282 /NCGR_PEP_ID=MMETSP0804-20121206/10286_1 /TAXON_ID=1074897 /ORGANISM="Tetraselmis astigmatica, Strain CCMP880" /LENGTH=549 /DNA_ID=CAMNT_0005473803 /DNA_START=107 /DNA_END=1756 /DNA_ORIENTATION=+